MKNSVGAGPWDRSMGSHSDCFILIILGREILADRRGSRTDGFPIIQLNLDLVVSRSRLSFVSISKMNLGSSNLTFGLCSTFLHGWNFVKTAAAEFNAVTVLPLLQRNCLKVRMLREWMRLYS